MSILSFLNELFNTIGALLSFVISAINGFVNLLIKLPYYASYLLQMLALLPSFVIPFATVSISTSILLFILNRNSKDGAI